MRIATPDPADRSVLRRLLERARGLGREAVAVFDLDSTLLDNRPRQARIVREYGARAGIAELARFAPEHFVAGWDMRAALRAAGVPEERIASCFDDLRAFWTPRFFSGAYCAEDLPIAGAPAFVRAVHEAGATIAYCTGRHEPMREGTTASLERCGFPPPGGERTALVMKPSFDVTDDAFKREAHARLRALGTVIAAFDNEPTHINDYHRAFPEALAVHLATDHSGRAVSVAPGISAIADFLLD